MAGILYYFLKKKYHKAKIKFKRFHIPCYGEMLNIDIYNPKPEKQVISHICKIKLRHNSI